MCIKSIMLRGKCAISLGASSETKHGLKKGKLFPKLIFATNTTIDSETAKENLQ